MSIKNSFQFRSLFESGVVATSTQDLASISDGDEAAFDVTCTGAALGDFVLVSIDIDSQNLQVSGNVRVADTVEVTVSNSTGGAINLGSAEFKVIALKPAAGLFDAA